LTKEKKLKVPKRIGGVKVPKKVRKPVNKALAIAENPATRDLAIAALTAAAAALSGQRPRRPGDPGTDLDRAGKITDTLVAAALDGASRLLDNFAPPAQPASAEPEPAAGAEASPRPRPRPKRSTASASAARAGSAGV
jgi:hypothetical protein